MTFPPTERSTFDAKEKLALEEDADNEAFSDPSTENPILSELESAEKNIPVFFATSVPEIDVNVKDGDEALPDGNERPLSTCIYFPSPAFFIVEKEP